MRRTRKLKRILKRILTRTQCERTFNVVTFHFYSRSYISVDFNFHVWGQWSNQKEWMPFEHLMKPIDLQIGSPKTSEFHNIFNHFLPLSPPGWRGIVVTVRAGGLAGGCQTCGTRISVTAWRIFSIRNSVELSRPVGVHCHGHMPICPIWACPWAKNLSNLPQIGSRLCGTHISDTAGWIYPI